MTEASNRLNTFYVTSVLALTVVFPAVSALLESLAVHHVFSPATLAKWFIFWAVGVRLFLAGLRQIFTPAFTAKEIFHIHHEPAHAIVRELGFANLCFGLVGLVSLWLPGWRIVSASASGLYYGLAGVAHAIKKPVSPNETFALISDAFIFLALAACLFVLL
jgi:hypothetical protein